MKAKLFTVNVLLLALATACGGEAEAPPTEPSASASPSPQAENEVGSSVENLPPLPENTTVITDGSAEDFVLSQVRAFYSGEAGQDCLFYAPHSVEVFYGESDEKSYQVCKEANLATARQAEDLTLDMTRLQAEVVPDIPEKGLTIEGVGLRDKLLSYEENSDPTIVKLSGNILVDGVANPLENYYYVKQYEGRWRQILKLTFELN